MEHPTFCFRFQLTPYDTQRLLPQVSKALEKRTELISRERYPALWKITDRISGGKPAQPRSRLRTKFMAVLCLVLGIFLFVPGVTDPQELLVPLITGALAIIIGILYLWRSRKHRKNPFDRSAQKLLAGKETLSTQSPVTVTFSENGMTFPPSQGKQETVPYTGFSLVVETQELILMVFDTRVTVLQKRDLQGGNVDAFLTFLAERTPYQKLV